MTSYPRRRRVTRCSPATPTRRTSSGYCGPADPAHCCAPIVPRLACAGSSTALGRTCRRSPMPSGSPTRSTPRWCAVTGWADHCWTRSTPPNCWPGCATRSPARSPDCWAICPTAHSAGAPQLSRLRGLPVGRVPRPRPDDTAAGHAGLPDPLGNSRIGRRTSTRMITSRPLTFEAGVLALGDPLVEACAVEQGRRTRWHRRRRPVIRSPRTGTGCAAR